MIIDTSFLFSFLFPNDELHEKALSDAQKIKGEPWTIPDRVLEELFSIATYKVGINEAVDAVGKLEANSNISIYRFEKEEVDGIFKLVKERRKKISFTDYAVLYLAKTRGEKITAYDRQLLGAEGKTEH